MQRTRKRQVEVWLGFSRLCAEGLSLVTGSKGEKESPSLFAKKLVFVDWARARV